MFFGRNKLICYFGVIFQIGADGRRSQIFLALSTAAEFRDHLSTFSDFYASLGNSMIQHYLYINSNV
jgi:hypothetical protein